jgi:hypothetical protein
MNRPALVAEGNRTLLVVVVDIGKMQRLALSQPEGRLIPIPTHHCDNTHHDNRHNSGLAHHGNRRNNDQDRHNNQDVYTSLSMVKMMLKLGQIQERKQFS